MTIAIAVDIPPSRILRALLFTFALLHLLLAVAIATGLLGNFHLRPLLAATVACAGAAVLFAALHTQKPYRVDVCGLGRIRLTVQQGLDKRELAAWLHGDSTLCPFLMLLLLRDEYGTLHVVAALPDALGRVQFRRLAAALRSAAARGGRER